MEKVKEYLKSKKESIVKIIDGVIDLIPVGNVVTEFLKTHKVTSVLVAGVLIDIIVGGLTESRIAVLVKYLFELI